MPALQRRCLSIASVGIGAACVLAIAATRRKNNPAVVSERAIPAESSTVRFHRRSSTLTRWDNSRSGVTKAAVRLAVSVVSRIIIAIVVASVAMSEQVIERSPRIAAWLGVRSLCQAPIVASGRINSESNCER